jgi:hypothetical protein
MSGKHLRRQRIESGSPLTPAESASVRLRCVIETKRLLLRPLALGAFDAVQATWNLLEPSATVER